MWRIIRRVDTLHALITALETMKSEICDRMTPLPELIDDLAAETSSYAGRFFQYLKEGMGELGIRQFSFLWKDALDRALYPELDEAERKALSDLGRSLGRYDIEEQRQAISYTQKRLEAYVKSAEEAKRTQGKMHAVLGLTSGLFMVLVFF